MVRVSARKAALVCCYGIWDSNLRSPTEIASFEAYYQIVASKICLDPPNLVLLLGGRTELKRTQQSEARSVLPELMEMIQTIKDLPGTAYRLEENSTSTAKNIAFGTDIIHRSRTRFDEVVVYCDNARERKVAILMNRFSHIWFRVDPSERETNDLSSNRTVQLVQETLFQVLPMPMLRAWPK